MLWPLIEKWEDIGSCDDLEALVSATEDVWRAHNSGVELSSDDESDEGD